MNKQLMTIAEFLFQCKLRINNSLSDEAIQSKVAVLGYTPERLGTGKDALTDAEQACENYDKEYGEVTAAFEQRNNEKEKAEKIYDTHVAIARIALKDDKAANTTLQLSKAKPRTLSGWMSRARNFYSNLLANSSWLAAMATFNIGEEQLQEGSQLVKNVEAFAEVIMREKGDAQNATKIRDAKLDVLNEWINDYESIAKIALSDEPQLLEKLGIVMK
ncbi:hypothetical protein KEM09_20165 [Carboxylicivirga mesophila]|uniref:Uncharacterized protein n=1 Tax=Carboxylicivirga mesophila TaxID=1166478 RepID=A0ABS5KF96_9BACT|nr:hypothetical protein [Carboxylicivirga mesophila]MBS2213734.1 hypothetical protein [Carboxylicivirga mesophila]